MLFYVLSAIPHTSINVDHYEGYHLPAGSIVIGNLWYLELTDNDVWFINGTSQENPP